MFQLLSGKRPGQPLMVTSVTGQQPNHLFYVTDSHTGLHFLVDTGAEISVIPPSASDCEHHKDSFSLLAVNLYLRREDIMFVSLCMEVPITTTFAGEWLNTIIFHGKIKCITANAYTIIYVGDEQLLLYSSQEQSDL